MRQPNYFLLIIAALIFSFSCSSDDDKPSTEQLLQNRWFINTIETINPPNFQTWDGCLGESYFDFGSNNFIVIETFFGTQPCISQGFETLSYELSIDNESLTVKDGQNNIEVWEIQELTSSQLVLLTSNGNVIRTFSR